MRLGNAIVVAALLSSACFGVGCGGASVRETTGPSGNRWLTAECRETADCLDAFASACPHGYKMISSDSSDTPIALMQPNGRALLASKHEERMVAECE